MGCVFKYAYMSKNSCRPSDVLSSYCCPRTASEKKSWRRSTILAWRSGERFASEEGSFSTHANDCMSSGATAFVIKNSAYQPSNLFIVPCGKHQSILDVWKKSKSIIINYETAEKIKFNDCTAQIEVGDDVGDVNVVVLVHSVVASGYRMKTLVSELYQILDLKLFWHR